MTLKFLSFYLFYFYFCFCFCFFMCFPLAALDIQPAPPMSFQENQHGNNYHLSIENTPSSEYGGSQTHYFLLSWQQWLIAFALMILLLCLSKAQQIKKEKKQKATTPIDRLFKRANQLSRQSEKDNNNFFFELSYLLIDTLEIASGEKLKHLTSSECMEKIKRMPSLDKTIVIQSQEILTACDNAKFALNIPSSKEQMVYLEKLIQILHTLRNC